MLATRRSTFPTGPVSLRQLRIAIREARLRGWRLTMAEAAEKALEWAGFATEGDFVDWLMRQAPVRVGVRAVHASDPRRDGWRQR